MEKETHTHQNTNSEKFKSEHEITHQISHIHCTIENSIQMSFIFNTLCRSFVYDINNKQNKKKCPLRIMDIHIFNERCNDLLKYELDEIKLVYKWS